MNHTPWTLYYAPGTCALAVHIALLEAGAVFHLRRVDLGRGEQTQADYLRLNPKGGVPTLLTECGPLTETPALLGYIAQRFPLARLAPLADAHAMARLNAFNSYLCSTVHVAHAHGRRGYRWADDLAAIADMRRKLPETMAAAFALIEKEWSGGPWVMGESYSIADPYLYAMTRWLEADGVPLHTLPRVSQHFVRMGHRRAVINAVRDAEANVVYAAAA